MKQIIETVINYSEGKDVEKVNRIVAPFKQTQGVKLVNVEMDKDYHRVVVSVFGEKEGLKQSILESCRIAIKEIDLNHHSGEHARMGAIDVIPLIPISNVSMQECIDLSYQIGEMLAKQLRLPIYFYEKSAKTPQRENLAVIRKGEFEGLSAKMGKSEWIPDVGPSSPHPTAGATAVGARMPLVAYNIDLATENLSVAQSIAKCIRHSNGGFRYIKAGGVAIKERGITQVTMNITDYTQTSIYRVFETVKMEAARYGVAITGSEIVGLVPMQALLDSASYYLQLTHSLEGKVIETLVGVEDE